MKGERKELIWVATGQMLTLGIGFLSIKILTNLMGVQFYGQLMLGISVAAFISLFIYGPLGQAAIRFYSVCRERGDLGNYVSAFREIHIGLFWVLFLLGLAGGVAFELIAGGVWPYLIAAAVLYAAVTGVNHGLLSMFSGMRQRAVVAIHQGGESAARLLGALIAMLIAGVSPATALLGYAAGSLLIFGSLFRVASTADELHRARPQRSPIAGTVSSAAYTRIYGEIWQYVLPFLTWAAIGFAFMHGDRWMLQGVRGSEAVGTYMAIYQIGSALPNAVTAIISQHIEPLVFERAETSRSVQNELEGAALIRRAAFYTGLFLVAMVAIASVWSKEIVEFVTTPAIARDASVLAWVVAGTSMIGIAQILTIQGLALLQPSAYLICKSVAAIALLGAAYFGATLRGADGVAMALALAGVVYLISVLYVNARLVQHQSL